MASPTATADAGRRRTAVLEAVAARRQDATALVHRYSTSPIKIAKTFQQGSELCVMLMDASPGMLAGDRYELDWEAQAGAHLSLTNQGFTKVHPSMPGQGASSAARYRVGPDACIETMMKPTMLYRGASYESGATVDLARGAIWMQADIFCPGRTLRGEAFQYEAWDNRISVCYEGELIHHQRQLIRPGEHRIGQPGAWRAFSHVGTFAVFSDRVTTALLEAVRTKLETSGIPQEQLYAGAAMTWRHGLTVLAAADSAWLLQRAFSDLRIAVRAALLGVGPSRFGGAE